MTETSTAVIFWFIHVKYGILEKVRGYVREPSGDYFIPQYGMCRVGRHLFYTREMAIASTKTKLVKKLGYVTEQLNRLEEWQAHDKEVHPSC